MRWLYNPNNLRKLVKNKQKMEDKSEDCLAVEEQLERKANRAITVKSAQGLGKNIKHVKEAS